MTVEDISFCFYYGAICIVGLIVALNYWYNEIFKKK